MPIADRLFTNAFFRTLNPATPTAEALASWQGRIVAVGSRADVDALVRPDTEVIDLDGSTVLPGFIETHMHPIAAGVQLGSPQIGYPDCRSIDDVVDVLRKAAAALPADEPIFSEPRSVNSEASTVRISPGSRVDPTDVWRRQQTSP